MSVTLPSEFVSNHPIKALTHGFSDRVISSEKTLFVDAWMSLYNKDVAVILVDWHNLASFTGFDNWENYVYDYSARNAIDVGEFLGLCLGELSNRSVFIN